MSKHGIKFKLTYEPLTSEKSKFSNLVIKPSRSIFNRTSVYTRKAIRAPHMVFNKLNKSVDRLKKRYWE